MSVSVRASVSVCLLTVCPEDLVSWELELQVIGSCLIRMMGMKPESFARANVVLSAEPSFQPQVLRVLCVCVNVHMYAPA